MQPFLATAAEQTAAAKSQADAYWRLDDAPLKIGAMCTVGPAMIADLIIKFRMDHPGVELNITDCNARALTEMLIAGDLDVALVGAPDPLDDRFHTLELFEERFVIAVPRGHKFAAKNAVCGADLHDEPNINRSNCEYFDLVRTELLSRGIMTRRVFTSERDDWVQGMIRAGMGFGFFPEFSVTETSLVIRPLVDPEFTRRVELVTVRGRPHSPTVGPLWRKRARSCGPSAATARPNRLGRTAHAISCTGISTR